jgi:uncharacterized membrane protein YhaH (DUF805 family)
MKNTKKHLGEKITNIGYKVTYIYGILCNIISLLYSILFMSRNPYQNSAVHELLFKVSLYLTLISFVFILITFFGSQFIMKMRMKEPLLSQDKMNLLGTAILIYFLIQTLVTILILVVFSQ